MIYRQIGIGEELFTQVRMNYWIEI